MAVRSRKTRTISERLNASYTATTTRAPFAQPQDVCEDVVESRTAPLTSIETNINSGVVLAIDIISGVVFGAVLMWFYLAFS